MSKSFKFGTVVFSLVLVFLIVSMSFAWYQAKVNQGKITDLTSESIEIKFNSQSNYLKPDVLAEGVVILKDGKYVFPEDYETNEKYYLSRKNVVSVVEDVEVHLDKFSSINLIFTLSYQGKDGKIIDLTGEELVEYFDIRYALTDSNTYILTSYSGVDSVTLNKEVTSYKLYLEISYKLPDELLPLDLVMSEEILLVVSGSLA